MHDDTDKPAPGGIDSASPQRPERDAPAGRDDVERSPAAPADRPQSGDVGRERSLQDAIDESIGGAAGGPAA